MTTVVFVRRFLADYVRNPVNLLLLARTGIDEPIRAVTGTLMFAVIYLAIGTIVGATVPNPVNGTVIVLFVWILDVFFGPAWALAAARTRTARTRIHRARPGGAAAQLAAASRAAWRDARRNPALWVLFVVVPSSSPPTRSPRTSRSC